MNENALLRKMRLNSKFMTSQPGSQTMKFRQLIEYNMRNIFLEKSYAKCDGELFPDPFLVYEI